MDARTEAWQHVRSREVERFRRRADLKEIEKSQSCRPSDSCLPTIIIQVQLDDDDGEREDKEHHTERPLVHANSRPEARWRRFLGLGEISIAVRQ